MAALTVLRMDHLEIPMADLGPRNQLSALRGVKELHASGLIDPTIPESVRQNSTYGRVSSILPYRPRDSYGRGRSVRSLPIAILENERLRATFLTSLGGRLWSIFDKGAERELLYQSPAIQPANLGLGNAWFSGGVEWNISTIGHSPLSTEPLHVGRVEGPGGSPILRLYEYERLRGTPYQLDAYLPDGSDFVFVHVRIHNPNPTVVPIYWWTNMAVAEHAGVRVLVPADDAFRFTYDGNLRRVRLPLMDGVDASYPVNGQESIDYFFDIPADQRPWIGAFDADGRGTVQASTMRLRGRKLFIWGQSPGGQRWQAHLSKPGYPYFEIQAGIAETQLEHLPMPAQASWSWLEAFGPIDAPAATVHGSWPIAREAVDHQVSVTLPMGRLQGLEAVLAAHLDSPLAEELQSGSGWGALERKRRERMDEAPISGAGTPFPDSSLGPDQAPWLALLDSGALSPQAVEEPPPADVVGSGWESLLKTGPQDWLTHLELGVTRYAVGDVESARTAWSASVHERESGWALRHLAMLDWSQGDLAGAIDKLARAVVLLPGVTAITIELIEVLIEAGRVGDALTRVEGLRNTERWSGRLQLLELRAALQAGDLDRVEAIFASGLVVEDLREGDLILEELWTELQARRIAQADGVAVDDALRERARRERPVPSEFDFRMSSV